MNIRYYIAKTRGERFLTSAVFLLGLTACCSPAIAGTWGQRAKVTASDGGGNEWFGYAVAAQEITIAVGAPKDDTPETDRGSAYVFIRENLGLSNITQVAKLTASDGAAGDSFGSAVAVDGDTVIVGVPNANGNQGAVYVFQKPIDSWNNMTQTAKLTAGDGASGDLFGYSVAISGDVVVVGAQMGDGAATNQGAVYIFVKPGAAWSDMMSQTAKLTAADGAADDQFGNSVGISSDTIIVGAPRADASQGNVGAAYIFQKPGTDWTDMTQPTAKLTAADGNPDDRLGWSVGISGDTAVAGAYFDQVAGHNAQGSAYVFTKTGETWSNMTHTAKLTSSDGAALDYFGSSVAISGDNVVVGAYFDDVSGQTDQGSIYGFVKPKYTGWVDMTETAKVTAEDGLAYDYFGYSVAISGNMAVAGAYQDDSQLYSNQGSIYVVEARRPLSWPLFLPAIQDAK